MDYQVPTTITIDGAEHPLSDFSPAIQRLVQINSQWQHELGEQRTAVAKTEAALRQLQAELTQLVLKELEERNKPAEQQEDAPQADV